METVLPSWFLPGAAVIAFLTLVVGAWAQIRSKLATTTRDLQRELIASLKEERAETERQTAKLEGQIELIRRDRDDCRRELDTLRRRVGRIEKARRKPK